MHLWSLVCLHQVCIRGGITFPFSWGTSLAVIINERLQPAFGKWWMVSIIQTADSPCVRLSLATVWRALGKRGGGQRTRAMCVALPPRVCTHRLSLSHPSRLRARCQISLVRLFVTLWTVALQVPLFTGFSRQEYWRGLPCPSPGDFPDPGIEPASLASPAPAGWFFITTATSYRSVPGLSLGAAPSGRWWILADSPCKMAKWEWGLVSGTR